MSRLGVRKENLPLRVSNADQQAGGIFPSSVGHVQSPGCPAVYKFWWVSPRGFRHQHASSSLLSSSHSLAHAGVFPWVPILQIWPMSTTCVHLLQAAPSPSVNIALDEGYHAPLCSSSNYQTSTELLVMSLLLLLQRTIMCH